MTSPSQNAVQLTDQILRLVRSGVPLESGLEALAADLTDRRAAKSLRRLASHLAQGRSLGKETSQLVEALPPDLCALLMAGERSGRLLELLEQYVVIEQRKRISRLQMTAAYLYPLVLLAVVLVWFIILTKAVITPMRRVFEDFGSRLPTMTEQVLAFGELGGALALGGALLAAALVLARWVAGPVRFSHTIDAIPLGAGLRRSDGAADLCDTLALLVDAEMPLPGALASAAWSVRHPGTRVAAQSAARHVAAGCSLSQATARQTVLPPLLTTIIAWGERRGELPAALRIAGDFFRERAALHQEVLRMTLPAVIVVAVAVATGLIVVALMLPLIQLIQDLS